MDQPLDSNTLREQEMLRRRYPAGLPPDATKQKDLEDKLLSYYGISKQTPFKEVVRTLYELFSMPFEDIVDLLVIDAATKVDTTEKIQRYITEIETSYFEAGREPSVEEKQRLRGKTIMDLERNLAALQRQFKLVPDKQLGNSIAKLLEHLATLRAVDIERGKDGPMFSSALEAKIAELSLDKQRALWEELQKL